MGIPAPDITAVVGGAAPRSWGSATASKACKPARGREHDDGVPHESRRPVAGWGLSGMVPGASRRPSERRELSAGRRCADQRETRRKQRWQPCVRHPSSETRCPLTKPKRHRTNPNDTKLFGFFSSVRPANERRMFPGFRPTE